MKIFLTLLVAVPISYSMLLAILKLLGKLSMKWIWITCPIWGTFAIALFSLVVIVVFLAALRPYGWK